MEIRIHIPHPLATFTVVIAVLLWWNGVIQIGWPSERPPSDAAGSGVSAALITEATLDIDRERVKQAVLLKKEEILRYQLAALEEELRTENAPGKMRDLQETRATLIGIIRERDQSEKLLRLSLEQLWEAEGTAYSLKGVSGEMVLTWPVEADLGISAFFQDEGYKARFGFDHHAVDIPVPQGTVIRASADGTVLKVALNGLGYSYLILEHEGTFQTVYGHITEAIVKEGDRVDQGAGVAKSGGRPGTIGAGLITTGPHLHFAVKKGGALVDPMKYLPKF